MAVLIVVMENVSDGNNVSHQTLWRRLISSAANNAMVGKFDFFRLSFRKLPILISFLGYGIADEFVDQNYCSEKCRKLSLSRPTQAKGRETGAAGKVAVKRKSTSSNASQASDSASNAVVESSLDSPNERTSDGNKDGESKV